MINTDNFIIRLEKIIDYYGLTASSFADKIGVQRSSLSHLLSGRNKPSLDFILKVIDTFSEVDLYWLLNGKGNFPKEEKNDTPALLPKNELNKPNDLFSESENSTIKNTNTENSTKIISNDETSEIEKIVVFYKNGTFKSYVPKN